MRQDVAQSVTKNTTVMMGSQVITWMSTFILMLFLPRYLGSEEYGRLYVAISIGMILQIVIEFGGNYFIPKEVSRDPGKAPRLLMNFIVLRILIWVASMLLLAGFLAAAGYPGNVKTLVIVFAAAKVWEGSAGVLRNWFQGREKMEYTSLAAIVERVFVTAVGVGALLLGAGSIVIAVVMVAGTLLNFLVLATCFRNVLPSLRSFELKSLRPLASVCLPYFLYSVFAVAYYRIDAVMLSLMATDAQTGWYGAAYRFFDVLMFLPSILATALFPVMARLWKEDEDVLGKTTRRCLDFVILAGIGAAVCVFAYAGHIIEFFFGLKEYAPSVPILRIFSAGLVLVYVDMVLGTALFASDRQRQWTFVAFFALLLNPLLNWLMIPYAQARLGNAGLGAAGATLLTELFVMLAAMSIMPAKILGGSWTATAARGAAAGAVLGLSIMLQEYAGIPWIPAGAIGMAAYLAVLVKLGAFEPAEIDFFRKFFTFRNMRTLFLPRREVTL